MTAIRDAAGALVQSGGAPNLAALDTVFGHHGSVTDAKTGLQHKSRRWYSPDLGRFLSEDPIQHNANWYVFAGNDPVNYADPTGLFQAGHPLLGGPKTSVTVANSGVLGGLYGMTNVGPSRLVSGVNTSLATPSASSATRPFNNFNALANFSTSTSVAPKASDFNTWSLPGTGSSSATAARSLPVRPYDGSINVDARELARSRDVVGDPLVAAYRSPRATAEIVASVLNEPIDWLLTAREIYNEPRNPLSYAGLIPGVPAGVSKVAKKVLQGADNLDEVIDGARQYSESVKTARAGTRGRPDHVADVEGPGFDQATVQARPGERVLTERPIEGFPGINRRPDNQIVGVDGRTRLVVESERRPTGSYHQRRVAQLEAAGIEVQTRPLP